HRCLSRFFMLTALLLLAFPVFPQAKKDLEKKKEQLRKDIEYTNQLLNLAKKNKSTSLNQLITLNKKISYRNELINTINDEIGRVDNSIGGINQHIDSMESRMTELKKQYARMLYF